MKKSSCEKRSRRAAAAVVCGVFLGTLALVGCGGGGGGRIGSSQLADDADYYPLAVGNRWVYQTTTADGKVLKLTHEITAKVGRDTYMLRKIRQTPEGDSVTDEDVVRKVNGFVVVGKNPLLPITPGLGLKWDGIVKGDSQGKVKNTITERLHLDVQGKSFFCYRVDFKGARGGSLWIAPNVGIIKATFSGESFREAPVTYEMIDATVYKSEDEPSER